MDIARVYVSQKGRLDIYEDQADIDRIIEDLKKNGSTLSEFEFYEKEKPVFHAVKTSDNGYRPLSFPDPKNYGMMAPELYSKAVTYKYAWQKLIESIIERKPTLASEIKKITVLALPITIMAFLIFVMVVTLGG